jgi:hypothetical protein
VKNFASASIKTASLVYRIARGYQIYIAVLFVFVGASFLLIPAAFAGNPSEINYIKLTQAFALWALLFLGLSVFAPAFHYIRPKHLTRLAEIVNDWQRFLIVSALGFALVHAGIAFFGQLGGFTGWGYLSYRYSSSVLLGAFALALLLLYPGLLLLWHFLPRMVKRALSILLYIVGGLILFHALILGRHFKELSGDIIPWLIMVGVVIVFSVAALAAQKFIAQRWGWRVPVFLVTACLLTAMVSSLIVSGGKSTLSVHSTHTSIAAQNARYNTYFDYQPDTGDWTVRIYDAATAEQVKDLIRLHGKLLHLIVFDESLAYFNHFYPEWYDGEFRTTEKLPTGHNYRVFAYFYPARAGEQQLAFSLDLTNSPVEEFPQAERHFQADINRTEFTGAELEAERTAISFYLQNELGEPVENIPSLGAFSYLTLINTQDFSTVTGYPNNLKPSELYKRISADPVRAEFNHQHSGDIAWPEPFEWGGPTIEFQVNDFMDRLQPGTYLAVAEFNPDGRLGYVLQEIVVK